MLRLDDVHVHIGKLHILQGVNLEVKPGECAALLGRNGVGKTTTLRRSWGWRAGAQARSSSTGSTWPIPAARVPRQGVGYVPQGRGIFPNLTVLENLNIGRPGRRDPARGVRVRLLSRGSRSASSNRATRSRAASSRCWRSPAA